ncbi:hypothetical protein GQ457_17G010460 [Hibiscus cannabinus]
MRGLDLLWQWRINERQKKGRNQVSFDASLVDSTLVTETNDVKNSSMAIDGDSTEVQTKSSSPITNLKPSFRDIMANENVVSSKHSFIDDLDMELKAEDVQIGMYGLLPDIWFSDKIHNAIDEKLASSLIVHLLDKTIGFRALLNRIQVLWAPRGEICLIDLDNDYFLVRFADVEDYNRVLSGGPWMVCGSYLTVQPWSRSFTTSAEHPTKVLVWVRLSSLPHRYYTKSLFRAIADCVGHVFRIDYNTKEGKRGKFARLAVIIDLEKPLISGIMIDESHQILEYEGLPVIYFGCGKYSHLKEKCGRTTNPVVETTRPKPNTTAPEELYGPWM